MKREKKNTSLAFAYSLLGFLVSFFLLSLSSSCKKDKINVSSPASFNYFPVEQGRFVIYNVDSIVHATNDNNNDDSVYEYHFQLKDVIGASFIDGEGLTRQVVNRYYRSDTSSAWTIRNVQSQLLTTKSAYRWEDNIAYHKMAFPINFKVEWNGNDKNTLGEELYHYEVIHVPQLFNNLVFDSTVTILEVANDNYVEFIYGTEVYANGIGLIFKERDELRKNIGLVVSGTEFKMTVAGYGME